MGREWRPGDVAMLPDGERLFRSGDKFIHATPGFNGSRVACTWEKDNLRPLVVIDPEDREQVERFREIASRWSDQVPYSDMREPGDMDHTDAMQAALREFANPKPPKPEEPTGLGAVVEDAKGRLWFRMTLENQTYPGEVWQERYGEADRWSQWSDIDVVRVLSEGVRSE